MTQDPNPQPAGWGVQLQGQSDDLEDCKNSLKPPFDPWVIESKSGLVLRSKSFDFATYSEEVFQKSKLVMNWLNGALSLNYSGDPVRAGEIVEFTADGQERRHIRLEGVMSIGRFRMRGELTVLGPDGNPRPPQPSNIQTWMDISENDDLISDALVYYSRSDNWFDIYKCLECLILRFGPSEGDFIGLKWASATKIKLLKQTANCERHARKKNKPPEDPMPQAEARQLIGSLLRRALSEVGG